MTKEEINQIIEDLYESYGLTKAELKNQVLSASTAVGKTTFFNGPEFQQNWEYTKTPLLKTEILTYSVARDVGLVLSIFSRETGPLNYRYYKYILKDELDRKFVTSGADVHKDGIAGFDFILSGGQKKFHTENYKAAGIAWKSVSASEFRNGKTVQRPARIEVKDFLFSAFSMIAFCNKRMKDEIDGFESLSKEAKRVWVALFFAGSGYARHIKGAVQKYCDKKGESLDYNKITDPKMKSTSNWNNVNSRLRNARRIALKAEVFDETLSFVDPKIMESFNKVKDFFNVLW